jgi:hypothetical protein
MEKSNLAFTLIITLYIAAALLLSRVRGARTDKRRLERGAEIQGKQKGSRPWTSFSS